MKIINIKGNSFFARGGTNTGIYLFDDNSALIIDPGLPGVRPRNLMKYFDENGIIPKWIINTHEHNDHYGAGYQFKEKYKDIVNMSSEFSKIYIDNPVLFSSYIMGGETNAIFDKILLNKNMEQVKIDEVIKEGKININNEYIEVISLVGHTIGSIGVMTKDKVLYLGDTLIGEELLNKFELLFLYDIEEYLKSLDKVKYLDFEYCVLGHCKIPITKESTLELISKHEENVNEYLKQVKTIAKEPSTLEYILKIIINDNELSYNYKEYHFFRSTLVGMISYLIKLGDIDCQLKNGDVLYYTKQL